MSVYLGIDIGTSSMKAVLIREDGGMAGEAHRAYDLIKPEQNMAEQDIEQLWNAVAEALKELSDTYPVEAGQIKGIGFSGQMHGLVALDQEGRPVRHAIIWADQRSAESIRHIYQEIPEEEYSRCVGNRLSTGVLVSSLVWVKEHEPETYRKIRHVVLPKDYIRYRMTGELGTDLSDASSTLIFQTAEMDWAYSFMDRLGLDRSLFPAVHASSEVAGQTTAACSRQTGLKEGIPVVYGGGDTIVQAVGNGLFTPGRLIANIGTASQLVTVSEQPVCDKGYRTNTFNYAENGLWLLMGANLSGGIALKWLKNNILREQSYEAMDALAESVPAGSHGCFFLPYLSGERTPWNDPDARGIFFGLGLKTGRPEMIRSVMEGIIYNQKLSLEIFGDIGISFREVIASGGGARGKVFRQMEADMFHCPVRTNKVNEQGCIGAAILAAVGCGDFPSLKDAGMQMVHLSDNVIEPDPENEKIYEEKFSVFRELYPINSDLMHRSVE